MQQRSALERFLNLFTEVRPGEAVSSLLLALNIYLILSAYYVVKPVREALILAEGSAEIKSYAAAGQALLLLLALPLYSWLASRVSRQMLVNGVTLFFGLCLLGFFALSQTDVPLGVIFYLWVGVFNLMVPTQIWALANDVYDPDAGKRLFVIVAFGASLGAVSGSYLDHLLFESLSVYQLMLVAAAILLLSLLVTNVVALRENLWGPRALALATEMAQSPVTESSAAEAQAVENTTVETKAVGEHGAFALVFRNRYLLMIAFLMLLLNWVNSSGEYLLGRIVLETAREEGLRGAAAEKFIGSFYASYFTLVNIAGVLLQLFVVSRILKYLGVRTAIVILPLITLGGYIFVFMYPLLNVVRWVKTAENSTDYSLHNTVRQILFLPTTREEKYKAKQVTDTLFVRAGDVLSALVVFVGTTWLAMSVQGFAAVNIALVSIWLLLAYRIGSRYRQLVPTETDKENP